MKKNYTYKRFYLLFILIVLFCQVFVFFLNYEALAQKNNDPKIIDSAGNSSENFEESPFGLEKQKEDMVKPQKSSIAQISSTILYLVFICFIAYWALRLIYGKNMPRPAGYGGGQLIKVIDKQMLAPQKFVYIVEVAGKLIVLGSSEQHVSFLTTLDDENIKIGELKKESAAKEQQPQTFQDYLSGFIQKRFPNKK